MNFEESIIRDRHHSLNKRLKNHMDLCMLRALLDTVQVHKFVSRHVQTQTIKSHFTYFLLTEKKSATLPFHPKFMNLRSLNQPALNCMDSSSMEANLV